MCRASTASHQLIYRTPNSASAAEDTPVLILCEIMRTTPLLARFSAFSDMKKWPPDLIRDLISYRYNVLLWTARIMSLVLNMTIALGCVVA